MSDLNALNISNISQYVKYKSLHSNLMKFHQKITDQISVSTSSCTPLLLILFIDYNRFPHVNNCFNFIFIHILSSKYRLEVYILIADDNYQLN